MAGNIKNYLMRVKGTNDQFEAYYPITSLKNVILTEDIKVMMTDPTGSLQNGEILQKGMDINTIIKKLVQERIPPSYQQPAVSISVLNGDSAKTYEAGTMINTSIRSAFTAGDAGAITQHIVYKGSDIASTSTNAIIDTSQTFMIADSSVIFKSTCSYASGAIKNDNFGEPYPSTAITAGQKASSNLTFGSYRKYFYGTGEEVVAPATSSEIRTLTGSTSSANAGTTFDIKITAGQRRVVFAYPSNLRDVSSVKYVEFNNDESKMFFNKTAVNVEGANGYTAIAYKVYTYIPDQAFPSDMTFRVTI